MTADSGTGARLGPFEGQVVAVGGSTGYTFEIEKIPVTTQLKVYREFSAVNRLEGTAGFREACGSSAEVENDKVGVLFEMNAAALGFRIEKRVIEMQGMCANCLTASSATT